ncbi:hypothetical protein RclHR1_30240001 [Rhizophagus clarus]|uniref:Uncharacterized protein n=1 Tax=Rhizophagus clarus TaxID=94130 RepID=A0A2Z6R5G1_9GLOM|nr:hypothetical protein RclHR1_30240001 [Rhizophagus clarus]
MVIPDEVLPLLAALLPKNSRPKYSIYSDSIKWIVRASTSDIEPPTSESLDSLMALVSRNHAKANKLRNDLKKCRKLLSKLVTDLSIVSEPTTHTQLITNVATFSRMILDGSFSLAEFRRQILTDELRLLM